jgi:uncharacterized protein (TIGR03118 family)
MRRQTLTLGRVGGALLTVSAVAATIALGPLGVGADAARTPASGGGTVLQTNLVSDLPGAAAVLDPNLVGPWGISASASSLLWISDNRAGLSTLYQVPGASAQVTINPLVVNIPTPVSLTGGAPTGTVFNYGQAGGGFPITGPNQNGQTTSASAIFLFATDDGTIVGWNPGIDPSKQFSGPNGVSAEGVIGVNKSGNNFTNPDPRKRTGAVYKGLAIATAKTPIIAGDANSTALLYAANFRAGTVEVYDTHFTRVRSLPVGAFGDHQLPIGYAPFNLRVLDGKVYVAYAQQDATKHDSVAGQHHGFVDVFKLDGAPGLAHGRIRLISGGSLNSPWGLAIAPLNFAGLRAPGSDPVLLVGNFGDGSVNAYDATNGSHLVQLKDPDGEPIQIHRLRALRVGNGGFGGLANTVYFTAGIFHGSHGLFGALSTVAAGTPEGPAEEQWVQVNLDLVQLDLRKLTADTASGAPAGTINQDVKTLEADTRQLTSAERAFGTDTIGDAAH